MAKLGGVIPDSTVTDLIFFIHIEKQIKDSKLNYVQNGNTSPIHQNKYNNNNEYYQYIKKVNFVSVKCTVLRFHNILI